MEKLGTSRSIARAILEECMETDEGRRQLWAWKQGTGNIELTDEWDGAIEALAKRTQWSKDATMQKIANFLGELL